MIEKTYNKTKNVLKKLLKIIKKPEMIILPGNLSFSLILSIFPAIILLGYIFSKLNISVKVLTDLFAPNIPGDVVNILEKFIDTDIGSGNVFITVILAFIFASNGTNSIITTTNILYKNEGGETIERRVKSFFLVILLMFVFSITVFILGFGSSILKMIVDRIGGDYTYIYHLFTVLKWPISFFIIFFCLKILYTIAPDNQIKSKTINSGALFTTLGWIIVTFIYSIYVSKFARYDVFYGSLSSIVILMVWVYILSNILVIGIAINANAYLEEKKANYKKM